MTLDLTRPFACRNGAEAGATKGPDGRLYGWIANSSIEIRSVIWWDDGRTWWIEGIDGPQYSPDADLINIPQRRTLDVWVNVYEFGDPIIAGWASKYEADEDGAVIPRTACIHIVQEYTEGEGLT